MMEAERDFDSILEECLEKVLAGNETIEQCLAQYPDRAGELEPLLETALAAREAAAVSPRPEFMERARYQFQAAVRDLQARPRGVSWFFGWRPQWVTAALAVLALVVVGGGTGVAAAGSMPDGVLYQVKLATESVRLAVTPSALGKVELYARFVDERVGEIVRMADEGNAAAVEKAAERLDGQLIAMADLAGPVESYAAEKQAGAPDEAPLVMSAQAPTPVPTPTPAPSTEAAPGTQGFGSEPTPVPTVPPAPAPGPRLAAPPPSAWSPAQETSAYDEALTERQALKAELSVHAEENEDALQQALAGVTEDVRAALLKALEVTGSGYERVLNSLD